MEWVRVCGESDISPVSPTSYDVCGKKIMLVVMGDRVYAADRTCTHQDADMSLGFVSSEGVRCPLHLSVFDLETGKPQNPPAQEAIATYNVKIEQGNVWVRI